eukprot:3776347-Ditylum_brightwellii.AAC.1
MQCSNCTHILMLMARTPMSSTLLGTSKVSYLTSKIKAGTSGGAFADITDILNNLALKKILHQWH